MDRGKVQKSGDIHHRGVRGGLSISTCSVAMARSDNYTLPLTFYLTGATMLRSSYLTFPHVKLHVIKARDYPYV
jgi:hypothetical protein